MSDIQKSVWYVDIAIYLVNVGDKFALCWIPHLLLTCSQLHLNVEELYFQVASFSVPIHGVSHIYSQ